MKLLAHLLTELCRMAQHIIDRARAALEKHNSEKPKERGEANRLVAWLVIILEAVLWVGDSVHEHRRESRASFKLIERLERHIMAADDEVVAEIQAMADNSAAQTQVLGQLSTTVDAVLAQLEAGNTQGAKDEAAKLKLALDPVKQAMDDNTTALQAAATKLSGAVTPPVEPPVEPPADQTSRSGR